MSVRLSASAGGSSGANEVGGGGFWNHGSSSTVGRGGSSECELEIVPIFDELVPGRGELCPEWPCTGKSVVTGPLNTASASDSRELNRRSWEDMKSAECLSPVHRVISMQSKLWFNRPRSVTSAGMGRGVVCVGFSWRVIGG